MKGLKNIPLNGEMWKYIIFLSKKKGFSFDYNALLL